MLGWPEIPNIKPTLRDGTVLLGWVWQKDVMCDVTDQQKAVTAYFTSKQLLSFDVTEQHVT